MSRGCFNSNVRRGIRKIAHEDSHCDWWSPTWQNISDVVFSRENLLNKQLQPCRFSIFKITYPSFEEKETNFKNNFIRCAGL
jgi:hypothetical protein